MGMLFWKDKGSNKEERRKGDEEERRKKIKN
jgi:hypothetical protein